jgi:CheY-like chemotaxis protein
MNLIINARDAMPNGGTIRVYSEKVHIEGDPELEDGEYVNLIVSDNGCGMAPDVLAKACDPFFTTKGVGKGTGLGLSMAYGMANQSGGRVEISSTVDVGTTIKICLPLITVETPVVAEVIPDHNDSVVKRHILIVDDDDSVRESASAMAEELGHHVTRASSGQEALEMIQNNQLPDLIIMDFAMPDMNGAESVKLLLDNGIKVPVLFASGFSDTSAIQTILSGEYPMLKKPFNMQTLGESIEKILPS